MNRTAALAGAAALAIGFGYGLGACGDDEESGLQVLAADAEVGGESAADLLGTFLANISEVPLDGSFLADPNRCDMGRSTDEVYFAPSFGAPGESSAACTMQADQVLFLNPVAVLCWEDAEGPADTACLDDQWNLTSSNVTIDGVDVDGLTEREYDSEVITVSLADGNVLGAEPGDVKAIARGQVVLVEGLAAGIHEVVVGGDFGNGEFAGSLTITLTVEG